MSSPPSRRSNDNQSAPYGSGRSPSNVRRTSSQPPQPPQPFQHSVSSTQRGTAGTGSVHWANHSPSNSLGTTTAQAQTAPHMFQNHAQSSGDDWEYMNQLLTPAQIHPPQQMAIAVPDLYPAPFTSGPTGQHDNPQRHDRQSSNPPSTSWTGDTRHVAQPRQPISPSTQPQTTSPPQNVLFANQPQYSPPGNRDPQGQQRHQPSTSHPVPRNNQYSGSDQMSRPVAIPNPPRVGFSSQPVVIPNTSRGGFSPQSLGSPNTSRGGFPSHPQLSPNPSMQGASLSPPQLSPNTSQQGASVYATQFNSQPSSNSHRRATSSEYDNSRLAVAHQPAPSSHRRDSSVPPARPGEGERRPDGWGFQPSSAPHVSAMPQTARPIAQQPVVVPNMHQPARTPQANTTASALTSALRRPSVPTCIIPGCQNPVTMDAQTEEVTEYCGEGHMSEALRRGVPICPACKRFPRRSGREYCGSSCEKWAAEKRQQQQQQQQQQHQPQPQQHRQPQQTQPQQQQQRQVQQQQRQVQVQVQQTQQRQGQPQQRQDQRQPPTAGAHPGVPNSGPGSVTWSNVAGGQTPSNNRVSPQPPVRQGQFHR